MGDNSGLRKFKTENFALFLFRSVENHTASVFSKSVNVESRGNKVLFARHVLFLYSWY